MWARRLVIVHGGKEMWWCRGVVLRGGGHLIHELTGVDRDRVALLRLRVEQMRVQCLAEVGLIRLAVGEIGALEEAVKVGVIVVVGDVEGVGWEVVVAIVGIAALGAKKRSVLLRQVLRSLQEALVEEGSLRGVLLGLRGGGGGGGGGRGEEVCVVEVRTGGGEGGGGGGAAAADAGGGGGVCAAGSQRGVEAEGVGTAAVLLKRGMGTRGRRRLYALPRRGRAPALLDVHDVRWVVARGS